MVFLRSGDFVERELDGLLFHAVIIRVAADCQSPQDEDPDLYDIVYCDDLNVEEAVDVAELSLLDLRSLVAPAPSPCGHVCSASSNDTVVGSTSSRDERSLLLLRACRKSFPSATEGSSTASSSSSRESCEKNRQEIDQVEELREFSDRYVKAGLRKLLCESEREQQGQQAYSVVDNPALRWCGASQRYYVDEHDGTAIILDGGMRKGSSVTGGSAKSSPGEDTRKTSSLNVGIEKAGSAVCDGEDSQTALPNMSEFSGRGTISVKEDIGVAPITSTLSTSSLVLQNGASPLEIGSTSRLSLYSSDEHSTGKMLCSADQSLAADLHNSCATSKKKQDCERVDFAVEEDEGADFAGGDVAGGDFADDDRRRYGPDGKMIVENAACGTGLRALRSLRSNHKTRPSP